MTVILPVFQDPFDVLLQGEQLRTAAITSPVNAPVAMQPYLMTNSAEPNLLNVPVLVAGEQNLLAMVGAYPVPNVEVLRDLAAGNLIGANGSICTPTGAIIPVPLGVHMMEVFAESTQLWRITGQTLDRNGSPLAGVRVMVFSEGLIAVGAAQCLIAETVSDGSGNYSVAVPQNTDFQLMAYLAGTPDLAGAAIDDVNPVAAG